MKTTTTAPDGKYIVFPEGGAWQYIRVRGGQIVASTEEAALSSHVAAGDSYAWLGQVDLETLPEVDAATAAAVVRLWDADADPELVAVCRID